MNFDELIGQTFSENELFELVLFEVESHYDQHFSDSMNIFFERIENQKIKVTQITHFENLDALDKHERQNIEKKEWISIDTSHGNIRLMLCRFDRTGQLAVVSKTGTRRQESHLSWFDEYDFYGKPITEEEMRLGFQELCGVFQNHESKQKLKPKKAVQFKAFV